MSLHSIDTQQVVDRLTESGVPDRQARAHAAVLAESVRAHDADIATRMCSKSDLQEALAPLNDSIIRLDAKIDTSIAKLESKLLNWVVSVGFLQGAVIATLKLLD